MRCAPKVGWRSGFEVMSDFCLFVCLLGFNSDLHALKNKDADLTNPNVYNSREKFTDHIYSEIEQKNTGGKWYKQIYVAKNRPTRDVG